MKKKHFSKITIMLITFMCISFGSCKKAVGPVVESIDKAVAVIDKGISNITEESSLWRSELNNVVDEMPQNFDYIKEDLSQLVAESTGMASSNLVCVLDAIPKRVVRSLEIIKAKLLKRSIDPLEPTICQTGLNVINLNDPSFLRDKITIYGYDFKQDDLLSLSLKNNTGNEILVNQKLTKQSDYQYTILLNNMENQLMTNNLLVLKFDGKVISEFGIIHKIIPLTEIIKIPPYITQKFFPSHYAGNKEFGGQGPNITISATIKILNKNEIWATISFSVVEANNGDSKAYGEWDIRLYKASFYEKIIAIKSDNYTQTFFEDTDHSEDIVKFHSSELVNQFICKGDTAGDDIGNDTNDDAYLLVKFNPITIEVQD